MFYAHSPGINLIMIEGVQRSIDTIGLSALFGGMFRGIPYRLYAAAWGGAARGFLPFVGFSFAARGVRFLSSIAVTAGVRLFGEKFVARWATVRWGVFGIFWTGFYTFYFVHFGW